MQECIAADRAAHAYTWMNKSMSNMILVWVFH